MKREIRLIMAVIILCMMMGTGYCDFEDMNAGARIMGTGGTYTGIGDAYSIFRDIAGMGMADKGEVVCTYGRLYMGLDDGSQIGNGSIGVVYPLYGYGVMGIGWNELGLRGLYKEDIWRIGYSGEIGKGIGIIDRNNRDRGIYIGGMLKLLGKTYGKDAYTENAIDGSGNSLGDVDPLFAGGRSKRGFSGDIGLMYAVNRNWRVGCMIKDINEPNMDLGVNAGKVGRVVGFGVGYMGDGVNIMLEEETGRGEYAIKFGGEKWLGDSMGVRGGIRIGSSEERVLGAGMSVGRGMVRLDYGFEYPLSGIKSIWGTHMVSLVMKYGEENEEERMAREERDAMTKIERAQREGERRVIEEGRKTERAGEYLREGKELWQRGMYAEAMEKVMVARSLVPESKEVGAVYERLGEVVEVEERNVEEGLRGELMRKMAERYIDEEVRKAWNILMYVKEKYGTGDREDRYEKIMRSRYAELTGREKGVSGLKWVDQKLYRALNYLYENRYDSAIVECEDVLELEPRNELALSRLGSAYYLIGQKEKAKEMWRKVLEINPGNREVREFLNREGENLREIEKKESTVPESVMNEYNESVKYYRYIETRWNVNSRIDLVRRIIVKYEPLGVNINEWKAELEKLMKDAGLR